MCINWAACHIIQRPAGDVVGKTLEEMLEESSREIFRKAWTDVSSGALPSRCMDIQFAAPGGKRVFTDLFLTKFGGSEGVTMVQIVNITRHKETERELSDAKRRIHLAAKIAGFGFWEYDLKTRKQCWDEGILQIYGLLREEFSGRWEDYVHPEDLESATQSVPEVLQNGGSGHQWFRAVRPDGSIRHIHSIYTVDRDDAGNPLRLIGVNFDITERKRAEADLLSSRQNLERILENIPVPVLVADLKQSYEKRGILMLNRKATEVFGYTLADAPTAEQWVEKAYPDKHYRKMVVGWWQDALDQATRADGLIEDAEFLLVAKDGTRRDVMFNANLVGDLLVLAMRDVTEQRKSAAALESAYRTELLLRGEAERMAKMKTRFLAGVSHEIRTPISALVGISQAMLLSSGKHSLPAEFVEQLETFRAGGQYLNLILTNLLDFSATESGHAPVRPSTFYLRDWVEDIAPILEPLARERSVEIVWCLPEDENEKFSSDPVRLSQVLLNLAHNAIKFSLRPGSRVWISVLIREDGRQLLLSVADEGPGIPTDKIEDFFREFGQSDIDIEPAARGFGLGLSVVRQNTILLGGEISTRAVAPSGICFEIEFPGLMKCS